MYYIRLKDDRHNRRYKVIEADSLHAAVGEVYNAQATGSIESSSYIYEQGHKRCLACVVEVNSDLTERQPYQKAY